jgi:hypothetical protein
VAGGGNSVIAASGVQITTRDISDAILAHISNFAVGLVLTKEGAGSEVLGSGVLISIEGRRGILTCGHVAEAYEKRPEIGLIRFLAGTPQSAQRRILKLSDTQTIIMRSSDAFDESKEVLDLAFTQLLPDDASSIGSQGGIFLNIEKNRSKMVSAAPAEGTHVDAILGLVAEFSQQPFVQGKELISPMRGVLHTGHICAQENGLLTVDAMDYNLHELPKCFGGMSGGGLWRVYFIEDEKEARIIATMLCGIASWQIDNRKIGCQGWDRIDQTLIPTVREKLQF